MRVSKGNYKNNIHKQAKKLWTIYETVGVRKIKNISSITHVFKSINRKYCAKTIKSHQSSLNSVLPTTLFAPHKLGVSGGI